jgi:hypothetical protein
MRPFRDSPEVELGPLDVGLERAAGRAMARLPGGGRVLTPRRPPAFAVGGVVGKLGLGAFAAAAAAAWLTGWRPACSADLALLGAAVLFGGASLGAVFGSRDHLAVRSVRSHVVCGRARPVLRRMIRLAALIRRGRLARDHAGALRRALTAAADPDLAPWIPADVRGRAQLLLARVVAAAQPSLPPHARREVRTLLTAAAAHLEDAAPAVADLAAVDRHQGRIAGAGVPHVD